MPLITSYRGFIYLLGSKKFGWYKIGRCTTPRIRIRELGILLPFKVELFALWKVENPVSCEKHFHLQFEGAHINGEWFSLHEETINVLINSETSFHSVRIFPAVHGVALIPKKPVNELVHLQVHSHNRRVRKEISAALPIYMCEMGIEETPENRTDCWKKLKSLYPLGPFPEYRAKMLLSNHRDKKVSA